MKTLTALAFVCAIIVNGCSPSPMNAMNDANSGADHPILPTDALVDASQDSMHAMTDVAAGADSSRTDVVHDVAAADVDARTIPPVMPGVWRNITPPQIDPGVNPCTDIQYAPSNPSILFAMYGGSGNWKSTDAGSTWTLLGSLPRDTQPGASLGRLLVDPQDPTHLYATGSVGGTSMGFWVTHDGGDTWAIPDAFHAGAVAGQWNFDVYNMVADPTDFNHVVMTFHSPWTCCGEAAGFVETHDGGATYTSHMPAAGMDHAQGLAILFDVANGHGDANTWLAGAGYGAGIFRTSDSGETWAMVSAGAQDHGGFDAHYSTQGYLYMGGEDGVSRSTDNGVTWQHESQGGLSTWTYSVISDGHRLYSSPAFVGQTNNQPFYVSPEGGPNEGQTWTAMSAQTLPQGPFKMVFDRNNGIIYNAAWGGGAWALAIAN